MTRLDAVKILARQLREKDNRKGFYTIERVDAIVDGFLELVKDYTLDDGQVKIKNFGTFYLHHMEERIAHVPRTGERRKIPARARFMFRPSPGWNKKVRKVSQIMELKTDEKTKD